MYVQGRCLAPRSARLYCESTRAGTGALDAWLRRLPRRNPADASLWAEKRYRLVHYERQDRGGHFAAVEQPQLFAADLNAYGDVLRELNVC